MRILLAFAAVALLAAGVLGGGEPGLAQTRTDQLQLAPKEMPQTLAPKTMTIAPAVERLVPGKNKLVVAPSTQTQLQAMRQGRLEFACNAVVCICRGDLDCNDMFSTNVCGANAICIGSFCYCDRSRTLR